jgi:hypothetical protein
MKTKQILIIIVGIIFSIFIHPFENKKYNANIFIALGTHLKIIKN